MVIHGNISQALNSMDDIDVASKSEEHINNALEIYYESEAADAAFKQKFMYRKAKALSMKTDQFESALDCIKQINNW